MKLWKLTVFWLMASASVALASVYDAGGGADFSIEYSNDWYRVPHGVVSDFLESQGLNDSTFNYSVVLASRENPKFFLGSYIFVCFEPAGQLTDEQIESILYLTSEEYGKSYILGSLDQFYGDKLQINQPIYDKDLKVIITRSDMAGSGGNKVLLEMKKIYEKGLAIFLCYSPSQKYSENESVFFDLIRSFSYKANKLTPSENDLNAINTPADTDRSSGFWTGMTFWILCLLVVLMIIVIIKYKTGIN